MTNDAALRLLVDGRELKPRITGRSHRFRLPANARHTRVASRSAVPAHVRDDSSDHRRLGVAISRVALDGEPIALGDPRLGSGWHDVEPGWRWTDGDAALALAGVRELAFDVVMAGRYWVARVAACPLPSFMETTFRRTSGTKSLRRTRRDGLR
jgi:hypothetical protein